MYDNISQMMLIEKFDEMRANAKKYLDYTEEKKVTFKGDVKISRDGNYILVKKTKKDENYFAVVFLNEYKTKTYRIFEINTNCKNIFTTSKIVGIYTGNFDKYMFAPPRLDEKETEKLVEIINMTQKFVNNVLHTKKDSKVYTMKNNLRI